MSARDIVVIGASAGGVGALVDLASGLPEQLPAALFVVVHSPADSPGLLPSMVARAGPLPAAHAVDGERIQRGRIYFAPPDHHILIEDGCIRVTRGPRLRALEEKAELRRQMAERAGKLPLVSRQFKQNAEEGERQAQAIRALLTGTGGRAQSSAARRRRAAAKRRVGR